MSYYKRKNLDKGKKYPELKRKMGYIVKSLLWDQARSVMKRVSGSRGDTNRAVEHPKWWPSEVDLQQTYSGCDGSSSFMPQGQNPTRLWALFSRQRTRLIR